MVNARKVWCPFCEMCVGVPRSCGVMLSLGPKWSAVDGSASVVKDLESWCSFSEVCLDE